MIKPKGEFQILMGNDQRKPKGPFHPSSEVTIYWYAPLKMTCCDEVKFIQAALTYHEKRGYDEDHKLQPDGGRFWYKNQNPWIPGVFLNRAELEDRPGGDVGYTYLLSQAFISAVVCSSGPDEGVLYGSVLWGHAFNHYGSPKAKRYVGHRWAEHGGGKEERTGLINETDPALIARNGELGVLLLQRGPVHVPIRGGGGIHRIFDHLVK